MLVRPSLSLSVRLSVCRGQARVNLIDLADLGVVYTLD